MTVDITSPKKWCGARTNRWVIAAAIATLIVGAILSRVIEPAVRVENVMLTANTPAIRLSPATPGPHPIALLAHGATGSKENLFRFGEALAAAGFDCYSVDQSGTRRIATRGGSRRDGDVAMAIFASYVIGQFMPMFY
jgi:hypothetical protein